MAVSYKEILRRAEIKDLRDDSGFTLPDTDQPVALGLTVDDRLSFDVESNGDNDLALTLCSIQRKEDGHWFVPSLYLPSFVNKAVVNAPTLLSQGSTITVGDRYLRYVLPVDKMSLQQTRTNESSSEGPPPKPKRVSPNFPRQPSRTIGTIIEEEAERGLLPDNIGCVTYELTTDDELLRHIQTPEEVAHLASSYIAHQVALYTDLLLSSNELDFLFKAIQECGQTCQKSMYDFILLYNEEHRRNIEECNSGETWPLHGPVIFILSKMLQSSLEPVEHTILWLKLLNTFSNFSPNLPIFVQHKVAPVVMGAMAAHELCNSVQQFASNILSHLATFIPTLGQKGPIRDGGVQLIVRALTSHMDNSLVLRPALRTLANLTNTYSTLADHALNIGQISPVAGLDSGAVNILLKEVEQSMGVLDFIEKQTLVVVMETMERHLRDVGIQTEGGRILEFFLEDDYHGEVSDPMTSIGSSKGDGQRTACDELDSDKPNDTSSPEDEEERPSQPPETLKTSSLEERPDLLRSHKIGLKQPTEHGLTITDLGDDGSPKSSHMRTNTHGTGKTKRNLKTYEFEMEDKTVNKMVLEPSQVNITESMSASNDISVVSQILPAQPSVPISDQDRDSTAEMNSKDSGRETTVATTTAKRQSKKNFHPPERFNDPRKEDFEAEGDTQKKSNSLKRGLERMVKTGRAMDRAIRSGKIRMINKVKQKFKFKELREKEKHLIGVSAGVIMSISGDTNLGTQTGTARDVSIVDQNTIDVQEPVGVTAVDQTDSPDHGLRSTSEVGQQGCALPSSSPGRPKTAKTATVLPNKTKLDDVEKEPQNRLSSMPPLLFLPTTPPKITGSENTIANLIGLWKHKERNTDETSIPKGRPRERKPWTPFVEFPPEVTGTESSGVTTNRHNIEHKDVDEPCQYIESQGKGNYPGIAQDAPPESTEGNTRSPMNAPTNGEGSDPAPHAPSENPWDIAMETFITNPQPSLTDSMELATWLCSYNSISGEETENVGDVNPEIEEEVRVNRTKWKSIVAEIKERVKFNVLSGVSQDIWKD